jgi:hypothetical protein
MAAMGQWPQGYGQSPVILRSSTAGTWVFGVLAAVFAFALVRGYLGASTTAGRIGTVIFMGVACALCAWAAVFLLTHRSTLEISADTITYAKYQNARSRATGLRQLVLYRTDGDVLRVVQAGRQGRQQLTGFTIEGSGTTLPLNTFGSRRVRKACLARGWQFPA